MRTRHGTIFYLLYLELLTAVMCIIVREIPVLHAANLMKYNLVPNYPLWRGSIVI